MAGAWVSRALAGLSTSILHPLALGLGSSVINSLTTCPRRGTEGGWSLPNSWVPLFLARSLVWLVQAGAMLGGFNKTAGPNVSTSSASGPCPCVEGRHKAAGIHVFMFCKHMPVYSAWPRVGELSGIETGVSFLPLVARCPG
jgi:hypothetical protein